MRSRAARRFLFIVLVTSIARADEYADDDADDASGGEHCLCKPKWDGFTCYDQVGCPQPACDGDTIDGYSWCVVEPDGCIEADFEEETYFMQCTADGRWAYAGPDYYTDDVGMVYQYDDGPTKNKTAVEEGPDIVEYWSTCGPWLFGVGCGGSDDDDAIACDETMPFCGAGYIFAIAFGVCYLGGLVFGKKEAKVAQVLEGPDNSEGPKTTFTYTGMVDAKGVPCGMGEQKFGTGEFYKGEFKDSRRHGEGTYTWANGDDYTGFFEGGLMHGRGTIRRFKSGEALVSIFHEGKPTDVGAMWSKDRRRAWRVYHGKAFKELPLNEAKNIAETLGLGVPPRIKYADESDVDEIDKLKPKARFNPFEDTLEDETKEEPQEGEEGEEGEEEDNEAEEGAGDSGAAGDVEEGGKSTVQEDSQLEESKGGESAADGEAKAADGEDEAGAKAGAEAGAEAMADTDTNANPEGADMEADMEAVEAEVAAGSPPR